jgi:hypothetical protein
MPADSKLEEMMGEDDLTDFRTLVHLALYEDCQVEARRIIGCLWQEYRNGLRGANHDCLQGLRFYVEDDIIFMESFRMINEEPLLRTTQVGHVPSRYQGQCPSFDIIF